MIFFRIAFFFDESAGFNLRQPFTVMLGHSLSKANAFSLPGSQNPQYLLGVFV